MTAEDLRNWRLIDQFAKILDGRLPPLAGTWRDPKRQLGQGQYLCFFLFALFNPVVQTVRGICAASKLEKVQRHLRSQSVSLGSFSEAQHLCNPTLLAGIFEDMSRQVPAPTLKDPRQQWEQWLAQDSSVFSALPRMKWAVYGGGCSVEGKPNRAVRLHLSFNVISDHPASVRVKPANVCERKVWKEQWEPGAAYVGDRYYGEDYGLFDLLHRADCRYILRLRDKTLMDVQEELPLSEADSVAGVVRQALVQLGTGRRQRPVRVVWVDTPKAGQLILVTNLDAQDAPADLVAQIYRRRWQVEGFFRWVKCLLGCGHWLAESQRGVTIQLYLALIGALLMHLHLGRRPNKRMFELLQFHLLGWAELDELIEGLEREKARLKKEKNKRD